MVTIQTNLSEKEKTDFIVLCGLHHIDYRSSISNFIKVQLNSEFNKEMLVVQERKVCNQQKN